VENLTISVATAASDLSLGEEVRLAKAALLYADHVTLYSPTAMMLASAEQVAAFDDDELMAFVASLASSHGPAAEEDSNEGYGKRRKTSLERSNRCLRKQARMSSNLRYAQV
jgi:hypothetical protein